MESIFETGRLLVDAHGAMERKSFEAMVQTKLAFSPAAARKFMLIARNEVLTNCSHVNKLPPSYATLYTLTTIDKKLGDGTLQKLLTDGKPWHPRVESACEFRAGVRHVTDPSSLLRSRRAFTQKSLLANNGNTGRGAAGENT